MILSVIRELKPLRAYSIFKRTSIPCFRGVLRTISINLKYVFMEFKPSCHTSYHINYSLFPPATSHKDLGVIFSYEPKWSLHYEYIITKAFKILALLCRQLSSTNCIATKNFYIILHISIVRSCLLYCSPLWRPHLMKDIMSLECVQRRVTRLFLNNYYQLNWECYSWCMYRIAPNFRSIKFS